MLSSSKFFLEYDVKDTNDIKFVAKSRKLRITPALVEPLKVIWQRKMKETGTAQATKICCIDVNDKGTIIARNIKENSFIESRSRKALDDAFVELHNLSP